MPVDAELTRYLFEHARDIVLVICPTTGAIIGANRSAEAAYGYSRDELLQMKIFAARYADHRGRATDAGLQTATASCSKRCTGAATAPRSR